MLETIAILTSVVGIIAAIFQLAFRLYRRKSSRNSYVLEVTTDSPEYEETRNISVAPQNIKSIENLLTSISRQSKPGSDESNSH